MWNKVGQAMTEFAIILPLFFLFLWGIFFLFVYCYNLIALQTMSRDVARAISVNSGSVSEAYEDVKEYYANKQMANLMVQGYYTWDYSDAICFPEPTTDGNDVTVTLTAKSEGTYTVLPQNISVSTSMYKESST